MSSAIPSETKNTTTTGGLFTYNRFLLKAKYSLYSALVFFIFANPETILIFHRFFGRFIDFITPCGAPTMIGIFTTTFLFFFSMLGLMLLPSE
jgi:hypothetical protein